MLALHVIIALAATGAIWFFSEQLSRGTDALGRHYRIDPSVRGATLDAVASSFPEFCTVVFALMAGSFEAGLGAVAGSALFNVLVIPAASAFAAGNLRIRRQVIRRDGMVYLAVVVALILAIWLGPSTSSGGHRWHQLPLWVGAVAVVAYGVYVAFLGMQARRYSPEQVSEVAGFSRGKVALQIGIGMVGIGAATHFLVSSALALFDAMEFSRAIAGVTFLAAATSLPDTILSVLAARRGDSDGAVSNAFGSNTFDILICLGLPILVVGGVRVDWAATWPLLAFLLGSTGLSITFLVTDLTLTRREAVLMSVTYLIFVGLALGKVL